VTKLLRKRRGHGRGGFTGVQPPGGLLADTNRLAASLTKKTGPDTVLEIDKASYRRGTSVPYARFQQRGFTVTRWPAIRWRRGRVAGVTWLRRKTPKRVPARPPVPPRLPPEAIAAIDRYLARSVDEGGFE
jgi:hypothetical protein